jgi:excisionase family DNA binding protein
MNEVFTVREAAARLKADPSTLRKMLREGRLGGFRVGSDWRIPQNDLDAFIDRNRNSYRPEQVPPAVKDEDATDRTALTLADTGDFEDWNAVKARPGQPVDDDDDAYWVAAAETTLDRLTRGEERTITLDQWEARHGLGG